MRVNVEVGRTGVSEGRGVAVSVGVVSGGNVAAGAKEPKEQAKENITRRRIEGIFFMAFILKVLGLVLDYVLQPGSL